jgi:hypothetical protein
MGIDPTKGRLIMTKRAFTVDKKDRVVYFQPPPLSAEKRQYIAPLGSNLGQANQPIRRKSKRNFDGKEYSLIGLTRFRENHKFDGLVADFQHKSAKNLVKKLNENGWSARTVRWKNQSGVYVKKRPNYIRKGTKYINEFPMASDYFTGKDSSNLYHELWLRKPYKDKFANAYFDDIPKEMWKKRRSNLEERPIIFNRKMPKGVQCAGCGTKSKSRCKCDLGKDSSPMIDYDSITPEIEKEARERFVMQYVDEMSDDRSHGNEYLGFAASRVEREIQEGKIPKDMEIVKQKIAEYMAQYEYETEREYNRLVGPLWERGLDEESELPFGGEFKNMPKSMKEELFDEIQNEIESFNPKPYRDELEVLSESFDSDIQYFNHGGQRIVYAPTDARSGKLKGKVLKVNREFENHESFDRFIREQNGFKNTTGYWEDYVSEYFEETAPFMLKYILPAESINDNYGELAKHSVIQERVNIPELYEGIESVIVGDKKYDDFSIQDIGLNYMTLDLQWKKSVMDEIKSQANAGKITNKKRKELENWVEKTDTAWQNFGVGNDMRLRLLDYEASPISSFPKTYNKKIKIYHGTDRKFNEFNDDFLTWGSAWFTTDRKLALEGYDGARGKGVVVEREFEESELNLATPADEDRYLRAQLREMGYDGIKYPYGKFSTDDVYEIWNYDKLKKPKVGGRSQ